MQINVNYPIFVFQKTTFASTDYSYFHLCMWFLIAGCHRQDISDWQLSQSMAESSLATVYSIIWNVANSKSRDRNISFEMQIGNKNMRKTFSSRWYSQIEQFYSGWALWCKIDCPKFVLRPNKYSIRKVISHYGF